LTPSAGGGGKGYSIKPGKKKKSLLPKRNVIDSVMAKSYWTGKSQATPGYQIAGPIRSMHQIQECSAENSTKKKKKKPLKPGK